MRLPNSMFIAFLRTERVARRAYWRRRRNPPCINGKEAGYGFASNPPCALQLRIVPTDAVREGDGHADIAKLPEFIRQCHRLAGRDDREHQAVAAVRTRQGHPGRSDILHHQRRRTAVIDNVVATSECIDVNIPAISSYRFVTASGENDVGCAGACDSTGCGALVGGRESEQRKLHLFLRDRICRCL